MAPRHRRDGDGAHRPLARALDQHLDSAAKKVNLDAAALRRLIEAAYADTRARLQADSR